MAITFSEHSWASWLGTEIFGTKYKLLNDQPLSEQFSPSCARNKTGKWRFPGWVLETTGTIEEVGEVWRGGRCQKGAELD